MSSKIEKTVRLIVSLLVNGEYEKLAKITNNTRLRAEHIRESIDEYPATLSVPPESAFDNIDVLEISGSSPKQWSVRFDLWTMEEGLSDLSAEMTLIESDDEILKIELDGIHVL